MRLGPRLGLPAILAASLLLTAPALAAPLGTLGAAYTVPTPPTSLVQAATAQIAVSVQNTGSELWTANGTSKVSLSYHWYDAAGTPVVWDGARTALGTDMPAGTTRTLNATVVAPAAPGSYRLHFAMVKEGVAWMPQSGPFTVQVAAAVNAATYQVAAPPAAIPAGMPARVDVALVNTGNQTWNASGANPVNLAYHWYDAAGTTVVWDGSRSPLGVDVPPSGTRTVAATVLAPEAPGSYVLRFALVKEGVGWLPPGAPLAVTAQAAFAAAVTPPTLPAFLAGATYDVPVTLKNTGVATWNNVAPNQVNVSYHWHDAAGNTAVWDGLRSALAAPVAPGASANVTLKLATPTAPGTYTLTIDLVREGVGWFAQLGAAAPPRLPASVSTARFAAAYGAIAPISAFWGEQKTLPVTLTNTGNVPWTTTGPNPVNLAYHVLDASGRAVVWDGARTALGGDVAPGQSKTVNLAYTVPALTGTFTLAIDLVREGVGWFADGGSPASRIPLSVTSGLSGGYGATTTPPQVTIGATVQLTTTVVNYGARTWSANGPSPVRLSYHIYRSTGEVVVWEGARGVLPADVPPFTQATVQISVAMPPATGDYVISWDLVQEGVTWFSFAGSQTKRESFAVVPGVVFYGKGFGHGVGMSQYGANGLANGAGGAPPMNAEQIVQKYYPGTTFQFVDAARPQVRVLLSQPSSQSRYRCGTNAYFDGWYGDVHSSGGFRVLDELSGNLEIGRSAPGATWQFVARGGTVEVWNNTGTPTLIKKVPSAAVVPLDPNQPLGFVQKGIYRGNFRFTNLGGTLRVINVVTWDDYVRGVIPLEMPTAWHPEALKAQAYAARSYGYSSYRGGASDHDVSDDQADQCYGGTRVETPSTNAAVTATVGKLITSNNAAVRAYFSSSSGGYTLEFGCWGSRVVRSGGTWVCTPDPSQPFLRSLPDPADLAVSTPANPRANWSVTFTGQQIRDAVRRCNGTDIGALQSVDLSNTSPPGVGHVISVRIYGSFGSVDLRADDFLRSCLNLRSTMVRLSPF